MKKILVLGGIVVVIGSLIILFSMNSKTDNTQDEQSDIVFNGGSVLIEEDQDLSGGAIKLSDKSGNVREINGSFSRNDFFELSSDFNLLFESPNQAEAEMYDIYHDELSGQLLIALHREPLDQARTLAITQLKSKLGLSDEELCELNISVITNNYVNEYYSGNELGVPNCPGEVDL